MTDDGRAIISWIGYTGSEKSATLFLRYLDTSGNLSPYFTLAQVKASRITGVPQLALLDKQLFLAWTETQREQNKTAVIRIPTHSLTEAKPQYLQFLQD